MLLFYAIIVPMGHMKKKLLFLMVLFLSFSIYGENFVVESYKVDILVRENYSMHIKEEIECYFSSPSHGIYRDIQYRFKNPNGNFADPIITEVTSFTSSSLTREEKEDGYYRFYLGSEDNLVTGPVTYYIEYDYSIGRDLYSEYDEFYFNIISPAWDTYIYNISWSVTFPKEIRESVISVYEGDEGSTRKLSFTLTDEKTISSSSPGLKNYGGITLRVILPSGYWTGLKQKGECNKNNYYLSLFLSFLLSVFSLLLWFFFGRDKKYKIGQSALIAASRTPMEIRYILQDGMLDEKRDLKAMLFYWGEKGYVKIIEEEENKKKNYTFIKLLELPESANTVEKALFKIIFKKNKVTLHELISSKYSEDYHSLVKKAYSKEFNMDHRLKEKKSSVLECIMLFLLLLLSISNGILSSLEYPGLLSLLLSLIYILIFVLSSTLGYFQEARSAQWKVKKRRIILSFWALSTLLLTSLLIYITFRTHLEKPLSSLTVLITSVLLSSSTFIASHIEKKTAYGHKITEEALSFKNYLLNNEEKDSVFFSYAVALKIDYPFKGKGRPTWLEGEGNISDYHLFFLSLSNSLDRNYNRYSSSVSSSSGVGGGFSGGGGGSW